MDIVSKTSHGKIMEVDNGGYKYERPIGEIGINGLLWPINSIKTVKDLLADCGYSYGGYMWSTDGPETVQEALVSELNGKIGEKATMDWMDGLDSLIDDEEWNDANKDQSSYSVDDIVNKAGVEDLVRKNEEKFIEDNDLEDSVKAFKGNHGDLNSILKCDADWKCATLANLNTIDGVKKDLVDKASDLMTWSTRIRLMVKTYSCWRMYGECSITIRDGSKSI